MITLVFAAAEPIVLLIIPPGTDIGPAEATLKLAAQDTVGFSPDDILTIVHLPPALAPRATAIDSTNRWENEGGSVTEHEALHSVSRPSASA